MKFINFVFVLFVLMGCASKSEFNENGLKFQSKDGKQKYILTQMDKFFTPPQNGAKKFPFSVPKGWICDDFMIDGLKVERLKNPHSKSDLTLLQLHGGGYVMGLSNRHRDFAYKHALITNAKEIYMLNYRIAPKYTYPAALEDAFSAYSELLRRGTKPENIVIIGDSAGGNLALALSLHLKQRQIVQPKLLILISPWTDMSDTLASHKTNATKDAILGEKNVFMREEVTKRSSYAGDLPLKDPRLSPLYADLQDLPPMLIQVGSYEFLLDDSVELAKKLATNDAKFTLSVYEAMPHDFALVLPELQESIDSFIEIRDFINRYNKN